MAAVQFVLGRDSVCEHAVSVRGIQGAGIRREAHRVLGKGDERQRIWNGFDVHTVKRTGVAFLSEERVCGLRFSFTAGGAAGNYFAEKLGVMERISKEILMFDAGRHLEGG